MIEGLSKIGLTGLIGFLLGLVLLSWLQPKTPGGVGFTIVLAMVICYVIESLSRLLIKKFRKTTKDESVEERARTIRIWRPGDD